MASDIPRNVFVAVGSTAIIGLTNLLTRLKEDGIYDQKKDDIFIGIDSDISRLKGLKAIDMDSNPVRIHAIQLVMPGASPEIDVVKRFDPDWKNMGGITANGVGGDRRLSITALNWTSFWDDIDLDRKLGKGDRVILMGSAFGGTATGMYWNLAEYISRRVRSKIESLPERTKGLIQFFGMLLLPECNTQNSVIYPLYRNLCAFLQDMQVIEWRKILVQKLTVKRSFRLPIYSAWDKRSNCLPVYDPEIFDCVEASNLPMETLFILPTPENSQGQTKLYFTELAFTLFYLNLSHGIVSTTIDSFKQKLEAEDLCFGGFNMVVARSASNAVLRNRYYRLLAQCWDRFWNGDLLDTDDQVGAVCQIIEKNTIADDDPAILAAPLQKMLDDISASTPVELRCTLPARLMEFARTSCSNLPYAWPGINTLIRICNRDGRTVSPDELTPLAALVKGYRAEYESMKARAANADNILENITAQLEKAVRLQRTRGKSKIARLVNGADGAKAEVASRLKEYLQTAIYELIDAHRAAATLKSMPPPLTLEALKELPDYASSANAIEKVIREATVDQRSRVKGFVSEMVDNDLKLDVVIPGLDFTRMFLELILAEGDNSAISTIIKRYETQAIDILRKQVEGLHENNPLKKLHTRIDASTLNSYCADVFRVKQPQKGILHFCYTCGHSGNIDWPTWSELRDGLGFESFSHFPGKAADNARAVLDGTLQGPGENMWFHENHVGDLFKNVQGVWLGTLDLNRTLSEILQSAFRGAPVDEWEKNAWEAEELHGSSRPRLMSLRDMVYLGVCLGAMEKKILDVSKLSEMNFNATRLNVSLKSQTGTTIINCRNCRPSTLGFTIKLRMTEVRLEWIERLMQWFNNQEDGFCRDYGLNLDSIDGKLLFERHCINKIKLQVPPECLADIETLFDRVYESIGVSLA